MSGPQIRRWRLWISSLLLVSSSTGFVPIHHHVIARGSSSNPLCYPTTSSINIDRTRQCRVKGTGDLSSSGDLSSPNNALVACIRDYISILRPATILQAVGALLVGYLAIQPKSSISTLMTPSIAFAAPSVYLSYGAGMAVNDVVDASIDAGSRIKDQNATKDGGRDNKLHWDKAERPLASGRISQRVGWAYCSVLSAGALWLAGRASSTIVGSRNNRFVWWTAGNSAIMLGYALGLQRILLIKNIVCGWLAISPLIGAACLVAENDSAGVLGWSGLASLRMPNIPVISKLYMLAAVGFPMQVAREILKDIEDVEMDQGNKRTLPMVIGKSASKRFSYSLVASVIAIMVLTPYYWKLFESHPLPVYPIGVLIGFPMCIRSSQLSLRDGHQLLKKSIYVLLASMIGALLLQR